MAKPVVIEEEETQPKANPLIPWDEVKYFTSKRGASVVKLMQEAATLRIEQAEIEKRLGEIRKELAPHLDLAGVVRVQFENTEFRAKEGYSRFSLDKDWAEETLIKKGVPISEIKKHKKESKVKPTVEIREVKVEKE